MDSYPRPTIPPMPFVPVSPAQQTLDVLERRLQAAEEDTRQLTEHLSGMGFAQHVQNVQNSQQERSDSDILEALSPYKARLRTTVPDVEMLQENYEKMVSRVCKAESTIQSLKMNFLNLQGDRDLRKKLNVDLEDKLEFTREAYEQEVGRLSREIKILQDELSQESETKSKLKSEIRELQQTLDEVSTTKAEADYAAEELTSTRQKLQRRINELREELEREKSLRSSLEVSHNTILGRVREMEAVVEEERNEVQSLTTDTSVLKSETTKLKEELKQEQTRKQIAETSYAQAVSDCEKLRQNYETAESDRRLLINEMGRLRDQYEELIKQLEQTQGVIDQQKNHNKELAAQNQHLNEVLHSTTEEQDRLKTLYKQEVDSEKIRLAERFGMEQELGQLRIKVKELATENHDLNVKGKHLGEEVTKYKKRLTAKDDEFSTAADGLEKELTSLRYQLQVLTKEKERAMKDKENLLEEVNQTVDSMVEERSRLQNDLQQTRVELESHSKARLQLELENANLLERVSGFEQQQQTQKRVETTMKEMMEQKNKLAYENGQLQSQVSRMQGELEVLVKSQTDVTQQRKINEALQGKHNKAQQDISDLKIACQRLENQLRQAQSCVQSKEQDYNTLLQSRDDELKIKEKLLINLQGTEEKDKKKVQSLQKNLEDAKSVNREIASTLEAVMSSHSQLQTVVENLQIELGKRDTQIAQFRNDRNLEQEEWKQQMKSFEERMASLREELKKEREKSYRKTSRDIAEIKKQNDNLSTRNMELVKTNSELRHKVSNLDHTIQDLKDKNADQKRKMDYLHKSKKELEENMEKMKTMKTDIADLEKLRDEYTKRNQEQAEMINTFMGQISTLQSELHQLAQAQSFSSNLMKQQEAALEKEKQIKEEMKQKYKDARQREEEILRLRKEADERLKEAHNESAEVSVHLNSAHEWFKDKFDKLQQELITSRKTQSKLQKENISQKRQLEDERTKAQSAAQKAKDMIRASRKTINQLADYAEMADSETKQQLSQLRDQIRKERDHSKRPAVVS